MCLLLTVAHAVSCGQAVKYGKTIAALPWVNHVIKVNRLTAPKDNLLHYPFPRGGVPGLNGSVSVTTSSVREFC